MSNQINRDLIGATLTRALTVEQINANRGSAPLRRSSEVRSIDDEARTIEVAFSSEEPVMRWFGEEILDHSPGSMGLARLDAGAAVLWNHDTNTQIGVVESARVDADRIGRAVLRFGRSARAEEIWQDVRDGVIRHVSVGYFVRALTTEQRDGEPDRVTLTDWEPYEISLVSVPADATVGVGRAAGNPPEEKPEEPGDNAPEDQNSNEGSGMDTRILRNANGDLVRAKVDENDNIVETLEVLERAAETRALVQQGTQAEQQRTASLLELGEQYSAQSLAAAAIRDGTSVQDFTRDLLEHVNGRSGESGRSSQPLDDNAGVIGMSESEVHQFSFMRAFRALADPHNRSAQEAAAFEFEASRAAERSSGRSAQGVMVPADVLRRAVIPSNGSRAFNTATTGAAAGDTGGYAIANDLLSQSFIDMLRARSVLLSMATPMGGLVGDITIPAQASGAQGYWLGEDEDATEDTLSLRQIGMTPKTCGVFSEITRKMLQQSSLDAEGLVRQDLARALALTMDKAGFYGTGSANQPLGIKNLTGINAVVFAAQQPTFGELVELETAIASDNADVDSMAYISNAAFRGHCKTTEKFAGSNGMTIWEPGNTVNGYRVEITNQVVTGDVFHGNFSDMIAGMWGGLDLTIDPYSNSKSGRLRIVAFQDIDFAYRHVESFAYGADAV